MPRLDHHLVLCDWLWKEFGFSSVTEGMKAVQSALGHTKPGWDGQGVSHYLHAVMGMETPQERRISDEQLEVYDGRIHQHWRSIVIRRQTHEHRDLNLLYFQWLCLVFTEHYLERWGESRQRGSQDFLRSLNEHLAAFNQRQLRALGKDDYIPQEPFSEEELPRLAFWSATGSGKTLLMHLHIKQLLEHLARRGLRKDFGNIILITPNDGLSQQHQAELELSNFYPTRLLQQNQTNLGDVCIIEITKLKETKGQLTVAVDHFGTNNIVLVDEGHRGSGGDEWVDKRRRLCKEGFSIEYSATFGQAIHSLKDAKKLKAMLGEYSKSILFDYSYKFFYADGFGKDFSILNISQERERDADDATRDLYLTGCLLRFFQQCLVYTRDKADLAAYLLEDPLMMFVGGSVTGDGEESDVVEIISFLARFLAAPAISQQRIEKLLLGEDGLVCKAAGKDAPVFGGAFEEICLDFPYNHPKRINKLWDRLLYLVFRSEGGGKLRAILLKGIDEVALRVGDGGKDFGVISVGQASKLFKLLSDKLGEQIETQEQSLGDSLFEQIKKPGSSIRFLIGAKKFTEGWSCWRVSAMGLMNIGKNEGSQIIQLFGRGVRLKGRDFQLKRSSVLRGDHPKAVRELETLHVFGVKADYMESFREYLEEEDVIRLADQEHITLPTVRNLAKVENLKLVVPTKGAPDFKQSEFPPLTLTSNLTIMSDWTPRLQSLGSAGMTLRQSIHTQSTQNAATVPLFIRKLVNREALYQDLLLHKREKAMYNLHIDRTAVDALLDDDNQSWYKLFIPAERLTFGADGLKRRQLWQDIVSDLLTRYCSKYYQRLRDDFLSPYREVRTIKEILADPDLDYQKDCGIDNFLKEYEVVIDRSKETLVKQVLELKEALSTGVIPDFNHGGLRLINFDKHLYQPLLHVVKGSVGIEVSPVLLNEHEKDFVLHLKSYIEHQAEQFVGMEIHLLRNQSRGKGISFFEDGNFYPDFILWLVQGENQKVLFIDPHGLRYDRGFNSSKVKFAATVKDLESRLGDPHLQLESFILAPKTTTFDDLKHWLDFTEEEKTVEGFAKHHVFFMHRDSYMKEMFGEVELLTPSLVAAAQTKHCPEPG